jgi:rhodanese-related sulfurtransferase
MKNILLIVSSLLFVFIFGANPYVWGHTDVTPKEAKGLIDTTTDLIVVDVREAESEYCNEDPASPVPPGHIPGALNYPWSSGVFQERYTELPSEGKILIVCRSANRSNQAAEFLDSKGYKHVYEMTEGMKGWEWDTAGCVDSKEEEKSKIHISDRRGERWDITQAVSIGFKPENFQFGLGRDAFKPLDDTFLKNDTAKTPSDLRIIGIAGDTDTQAYSIPKLTGHEIANTTLGSEPIAAAY